MIDRVADQVAQRLREPVRVRAQQAMRDGAELEASLGVEHREAVPQLADIRLERHLLEPQERSLFAAREQQQVIHQPG